MPRKRSYRTTRGKRPHYVWLGIAAGQLTLTAPASVTTKFLTHSFSAQNLNDAGFVECTIRRVELMVAAKLEANSGGTDLFQIATGLLVAEDDARSVGISALPGALGDPSSPWVAYGSDAFCVDVQSTAPVGNPLNGSRFALKSQSNRRIERNDSIVMITSIDNPTGSSYDIEYSLTGRILISY